MASTTRVTPPTARVRFGAARAEITPPVGIHHRIWGASRHDRATGVHRPLYGDVMVIQAVQGSEPPMVRVQLDLVSQPPAQHAALASALGAATGVSDGLLVITYSHTHSAGWLVPVDPAEPGGELIEPYLGQLHARLAEACRQAAAALQPVTMTYATGRCSMAGNRDYWDAAHGGYVCGLNPDAPADDTVLVARVADDTGHLVATIVNYACHPTTLAWENTLLSPDFVGALRAEVERVTGAPCVFLQGACGDLGPRRGFVGDPAVADQNGRQVAHAALAALDSMGPPATELVYQGPVVSGATLGTWVDVPMDAARLAEAERFAGGSFVVDLPLRPLPSRREVERELEEWTAAQRAADARGDAGAARDAGARAERARRWLARLDSLPPGPTCPMPCTVHRLGDAVWVTCGGEPYNQLQRELRACFPHLAIICSPLAGHQPVGYLLPRDRYGKGLYQEEVSTLAAGSLELLADAIANHIERVCPAPPRRPPTR